jgi:hypothetical protein
MFEVPLSTKKVFSIMQSVCVYVCIDEAMNISVVEGYIHTSSQECKIKS